MFGIEDMVVSFPVQCGEWMPRSTGHEPSTFIQSQCKMAVKLPAPAACTRSGSTPSSDTPDRTRIQIDPAKDSTFLTNIMKRINTSAICLLLTCLSLAAGEVDMPRGFLAKKDYETAQKTAAAEKKPIAVMLTEIKTNCPICENTSNAMIKALRNRVVWVHVAPKEGYDGLSKAVDEKFRTAKVYPFLAIVDPISGEVLAFTHQKEYSADNRKSLKSVKDAVRDFSKAKS